MDKNCLVMCDSGGFQIGMGVTKEDHRFNYEISFDWCERNGNIFPILDYPLFDDYHKTFEECITNTVRNGEYAVKKRSKKRKKEGVKILNVLQGRDIDEMNEWYNEIKHLKLDGWAVGGQSDNPSLMIYAIRKLFLEGELSKKRENWLHIFGSSSFETMLYLAVVQKHLNKLCNVQLSYDSATMSHTIKYGNLMETKPNLSRFVKGKFTSQNLMFSHLCESIDKYRFTQISKHWDYKNVKKDTKLPLPYSPVVSQVVDTKKFLKEPDLTILGNQHNLWMMVQQKELFDSLVFFPQENVIYENIGNELKWNIGVIDHIFSKKELRKKYTLAIENPLVGFNQYLDTDDLNQRYNERVRKGTKGYWGDEEFPKKSRIKKKTQSKKKVKKKK
jgi:hypothetical protein